jgi:hypothetical protein
LIAASIASAKASNASCVASAARASADTRSGGIDSGSSVCGNAGRLGDAGEDGAAGAAVCPHAIQAADNNEHMIRR